MDDTSPEVPVHATLDTVLASMEELRTVAVSLAKTADISQQVMQRLEVTQKATEAAMKSADENRRYGHVSRWISIIAVVGFVLDITLTGWGVVLYERTRANTATVQADQARTSSDVWCPLYQVLAKALAGPPMPGATSTQLAIRQGLLDVVNAGKPALHCPPAPN